MNNALFFNIKVFSKGRSQERTALVDTFGEAVENAIEKCTYPTVEIERIEFEKTNFYDETDEYYGMCGY